jgi:ferredoxin-NADP reductase
MSCAPDTGDPFTITATRVTGGRMSNWMNDHLAAGDSIDVLRPTGLFVLHDRDAPIVAFAGGSGITPVLSIIKSALATTERPIRLVYANQRADVVIFADALERLREGSGGRLSIHHHLDDERGFLDAEECAALVEHGAESDFYVCGPGPYMDTVEAGLATLGVAPERVFIERFVVPDAAPVPAENAAAATEELVIKLEQQETQLRYEPGDTILDAARRAGLNPPFSCEQGNCATCMAHLDEGTVTMRVNNVLTPDEVEDDWVLTCQGLPTSRRVVVDYDA